ncbi:GSCOCG00010933001-RA-CDS, partial [Cotesia congregata]
KEQAIVLDTVDGTPTQDYALVIATKIDPENIRHISRISNNRVCVYLSSKEIADQLIDIHQAIIITNQRILIRPLFSWNKRLIISNVQPIIPNDIV